VGLVHYGRAASRESSAKASATADQERTSSARAPADRQEVRIQPGFVHCSHRRYQAGDKECREPVSLAQVVGEPAY
jgi:hypothetical protein